MRRRVASGGSISGLQVFEEALLDSLRMNPQLESQIISRVLSLLAEKTTDMADIEFSLPVEPYIDAGLLAREQAVLFRRYPLVVGHASKLAQPGDFMTHDDAGIPFLLVRDKEGTLQGFLNVCRHRGTRLCNEPAGQNRKAFTCPYHNWSYDCQGTLFHIPHAAGFPSLKQEPLTLTKVAVAEQAGLLFVRADPGIDIATHLLPLADDLAEWSLASHVPYRTDSFVRELNWKIAIEIFLEGYHLKYAHKDSIYPLFFDNVSISESFAPHYRGVFPKRSLAELANADKKEWRLRPHANILYQLFPNTLLLVQPDHVTMVGVFPEGTDRTRMVATTLIPSAPKSEKEERYWNKNIDILLSAIFEDLALGETIQRGVRSGANQRFRLGRFEHGLRYFHEALGAAMQSAKADA